jgi:chromosome transmission fidelity protein 4
LKLFAATVEAGKLERALDLVDRLHLEKSYDLAITLADRHDKLADMIEDAKERRFAVDDNQGDYEEDVGYEEEEEESPSFGQTSAPSYKQISPDMNQNGKRSLSLSGNSLLPSKRRMNL